MCPQCEVSPRLRHLERAISVFQEEARLLGEEMDESIMTFRMTYAAEHGNWPPKGQMPDGHKARRKRWARVERSITLMMRQAALIRNSIPMEV